ncbi:nucleoside deaminase [Microbacterium sp. MEC084]|jgi:tRNA(Arg) A34 adenosine deaminase TadA|uniref:nucleoside deaminase n=1 Tax=unclassified Microbacterium TaxID=2609290 RepID=UPI0006F97F9B|nr:MULTISPECIES: nucleoside deaminase [unclassified Microbacterium]KQY96895.1 CMP deaminase [Microbacterium sp. Root53]MCD1268066.1 nucleoside deaminase [Microbacterium sp. MEC084]
MDFPPLATRFTIELPEWIRDELADVPDVIPSRDERMALVNRLADRNWREGNGGPFAAMVAETATGRIVSVGVNVVLKTNISSGHAEVTALGLAQARLGAWDLGGEGQAEHELLVNWRPCVQCYGAAMWSGIRTLIIAGSGPECEDLTTFDEGPMIADWAGAFEARGIRVVQDLRRDEAVDVFRAYREAVDGGGVTVYNARNGAA